MDKYQYISLNFNIFRFFEPAKLPKSLHICNKKTKKAFFFLIFFVDSKKYRTFAAKLWLNSMKTSFFKGTLSAQFVKCTAIVCGMVLCATQSLYANNDTTQVVSNNETNTIALAKPNTANWSLFLDAGGNLFDGDFGKGDIGKKIYGPTVGLGFVYNFNTVWGIGAEYMFSMHQVKSAADGAELLNGQMHRAHAFLTFDAFNVWRPYQPSKIFALNVIAGGGLGISALDQTIKEARCVPIVTMGAEFMFNVSKSVSLSLKGLYSYSITEDAWDGMTKGTSNDGIADVMLSVRYKLGTKNKPHALNQDYDLHYMTQVRDEVVEQVAPIVQQVLVSEERKRDTIVVFDTVVVKEEVAPTMVANNVFYAYFDLNKSDLSNDALKAVQQAAAQLNANEELYAEVVGYGDNTGSVEYNKKLTTARVNTVTEELKSEYGVAAERVVGYSGGIIEGKRSKGAYAPNRRVEIRLVTKEEFETISQETAAKEEASACKNTSLKTIIVEEGMTLSLIAKAEYGDASRWTCIYEANKNVLSSPDKVQAGQELVIP